MNILGVVGMFRMQENKNTGLNRSNYASYPSQLARDSVSFTAKKKESKQDMIENAVDFDCIDRASIKKIIKLFMQKNHSKPTLSTRDFLAVIDYFGYRYVDTSGDHDQYANDCGCKFSVVSTNINADPKAVEFLGWGLANLNETFGELCIDKNMNDPKVVARFAQDIASKKIENSNNQYRIKLEEKKKAGQPIETL